MEKKGLLRSTRELVDGKFRRMYRATPAGRAALRVAKKRVQELFAEVRMWDGAGNVDERASVRPESAPAAPSRNPAAAASQSDPTRRPGGSA